jgi:hypothetical protein
MPLEIPVRSFFDFCAPCRRLSAAPVIDGDLSEWSEQSRLPDLAELSGDVSFADVSVGWTDEGLYLAVLVTGLAAVEVDAARPLRGDGLQVWVDTRDVRDAHRASRYCHHFYFLPGKGRRKPAAGQIRIRRARAHGRACDPGELSVASRTGRSGYALEARIAASALTGFDPSENRRLGFTYLLKDGKLGRQAWTADEPLPVSYDPSLWGALELTDE